jgi:hypothetical protein
MPRSRLRLSLLALSLTAAACSKGSAAVDAGTVFERGTDLRSAITTLFPEYRGALLGGGRAQVTRWVAPATEAELTKAKAEAEANGFKGEPPQRTPFVLEQSLDGGVLVQELRLPLTPEELGRISAAPAAMSSEAMAHWLPKVGPKTAEQFEVELFWVARDVPRAGFLIWQLVDGALNTGWKGELPKGFQRHRPDGGAGEVPESCTVVVTNERLGARIEVVREAERARLRYVLATFERR